MHNDLDESKYSVGSLGENDLQKLFPTDALPEADSSSRAHWDVLAAIDKRDSTEIFGNVDADAQVLSHAESFKTWWKIQINNGISLEKRIDALFTKPNDWPKRSIPNHKHFIELRIPTRVGWLTEVRLWLRNDQKRDPWNGSNFLITPTPHETMLYVDIYGGASGLPIRVLKHVVTQMTRPFQCTHDQGQSRALWMSSARLIARAFEVSLKTGFSLQLSPISASEGHTGYACVGHTYEFVRGLVKNFLPLCTDTQRAIELRQTITIADNMGHWRSPAMLLLAKAEVLDNKTNSVVTDIDGLLGLFLGKELYWLIVETKAGHQSGYKQLQRGLGKALISGLPKINKTSIREQEVWYFEIKSPRFLP